MFKDFFRDKKGKYVLWQKPNAPLWIAFGFWLLGFIPLQILELISRWGVTLSLLYWSYLEIARGESPFRRLLGTITLIYTVFQLFKLTEPFF